MWFIGAQHDDQFNRVESVGVLVTSTGLDVPPFVKTSLAPGSQVVTLYLAKSGLMPYLEALGFHVVVLSVMLTGSPVAAAAAATSAGIGIAYSWKPLVTRTVPSSRSPMRIVTSAGGAAGGRPPSFIQIASVRSPGSSRLTITND